MAGNDLEPGTLESGKITRARYARRQIRIERIRFQRGRACSFGGLFRCGNQRRRNALFAIALADVETGKRPHWYGIDAP